MTDTLMYIIGVLMGIFILLSVLSYKNYIYLFKNGIFGKSIYIENMENIDDTTNTDNINNKDNTDNKDNTTNTTNINNKDNTDNINNKDNTDNTTNMTNTDNTTNMTNTDNTTNMTNTRSVRNININYDDTDEYNTIVCNKNIIDNFKISRLLKKRYLISLISSYYSDNLNDTKLLLDNKTENSKNIIVSFSKKPYLSKYPLNPYIVGFNIKNIDVNIKIPNNHNQELLGMMWKNIGDKIPEDLIELKPTIEGSTNNSNGIKKLKDELGNGKLRFIENDWVSFNIKSLKVFNYVNVNDKIFIPILFNTSTLDISTFFITFKFKDNNKTENNLLFIKNLSDGNLISINIVETTNVVVNNINSECSNNEDCNDFMISLHNNINNYNEYNIKTKDRIADYGKYLDKNCKDNDCNNIKKNNSNEISFFNEMYSKKKYTIQIKINIHEYNIYNVDADIFDDDKTFIGLILNNEDITVYVNNTKSVFKKKDSETLQQSYPIIINNLKNSDIILYSFAFFKDSVCDADISSYHLYNNYHLNGNIN